MSDKPQFERGEAIKIANSIVAQIIEKTERCVIAGSIRRRKPYVGDAEVLYVPKMFPGIAADMFSAPPMLDAVTPWLEAMLAENVLSKRLNKLGNVSAWGPENKLAVHVASGLPVDFFATTIENFNVALVIRTGGKAMNLMLTTGANKLNRTLNAYGCGITDRKTGEVIKATSEEHLFDLCGCKYLPPEKRP
jgi:DNA polymerase/3'-5' exonuclease PolX